MKLFGGTSNQSLTQEVCQYLGIPPGKMMAKTFSDGETQIEIHENTLKGSKSYSSLKRGSPKEPGWGGRIRTSECGFQRPVSYRLTTPQYWKVTKMTKVN